MLRQLRSLAMPQTVDGTLVLRLDRFALEVRLSASFPLQSLAPFCRPIGITGPGPQLGHRHSFFSSFCRIGNLLASTRSVFIGHSGSNYSFRDLFRASRASDRLLWW